MAIPTLEQLMNATISQSNFDTPIPVGTYNGVITDATVRQGAKGPYINVEVTVHDDEYVGRKVWRIASFSEKALYMPGGIAELVQITKPDMDPDIGANEMPAFIANHIVSQPVRIEVGHEQVKRDNVLQFNADGTPELRAKIDQFFAPTDEFVQAIEAQAAGVDDDLPF